jgi:hypothetical protein
VRLARLPVIGVFGDADDLIGLELDELERAGADRFGAHVARRYVAWIDRCPAGGEQCQKRGLDAFEMKGDLVVAVGAHFFEVVPPGFARIDAELFRGVSGHQIHGAFDIIGGERSAVVPFHPLAQRQRQLGALLVPRPAGGQVGDDRLRAVLRHILVIHD